ncbi:MAG: hypothetical protein FD131_5195 [Rhodocyclaceae bacterium]|nr:MAG: hypothetical protein FD131_5195 [Rhodocyclaceae bacterium]
MEGQVIEERTSELKLDNNRAAPPGWGNDRITAFLGSAYQNTWATFHNMKGAYSHLNSIEGLYQKATTLLDNKPEAIIPIALFFRAHSAFLTGAGLSMAGQLREAYSVLRGCLEDALYAWHIDRTPGLAEVWLKRDDDEKSRKRSKIVMRSLLEKLKTTNPAIGESVEKLYERTIDYGGHPNKMAVLSNMRLIRDGDGRRFDTAYLNSDSVPLQLALKTSAQVGIAALLVFDMVFKTRFELASLSKEIAVAKRGL